MRRALAQLAIEIEQLKFQHIDAERAHDIDRMECILNKLSVLEELYNHEAAIVNGDNLAGSSHEDLFIRRIQNDTFNTPYLILSVQVSVKCLVCSGLVV